MSHFSTQFQNKRVNHQLFREPKPFPEIEFMLPKRRARASRFWKVGIELYLFLPRSRPFPGNPIPDGAATPQNQSFVVPNPHGTEGPKIVFFET